MNSQELHQWKEDFSSRGRAMPEPPPIFLAAVRARRVRRRLGQCSAVVLVLLSVTASLMWSARPQSGPAQVANLNRPTPLPSPWPTPGSTPVTSSVF